jgi:hypothetical protein
MERLILQSLRWSARITLWSAKAPFVMARQLYRATRQLSGARLLATNDALPCRGCGEGVSLVGRFECGRCHYIFDGFAFAGCAVCGAIPPYITCQSCGVGLRNPVRSP